MWERLSSSFWFLPGLLTTGSAALFYTVQYLDQVLRLDPSSLPVVFSGGATAARSVLSAVSSSIITVAATIFSLTIIALQLASAQYSPRLLRTFTADRGIQVVLGAYIGTFLYSLLVLRIIRTPESQGATTFNPVISVTVAIVLALACVALLIYFIQHVANMIQSSTIVRAAEKDAIKAIANLGDLQGPSAQAEETVDPEEWSLAEDSLGDDPLVVQARASGYVQYLDVDGVLRAAGEASMGGGTVIVEIPFGPGKFVAAGLPIVRIWPAGEMDPAFEEEVRQAFFFGRERSFKQDFAFGLRQLSDIALKGLSPGVNDPTTSMQAMDRIEAIFVALGSKALPSRTQRRQIGDAKVLAKVGHYGFEDVAGLAFDQIRRSAFASGQVAVLERLLETIQRALQANPLPERQRVLWTRAFTVARLAPGQVSDPHDAVSLLRGAVRIGAPLLETDLRTGVTFDLKELAGISDELQGGEQVREVVDAALKEPG
ncbi:MAG: DUF2254 domain-containing protein [Actinomycetota bacterium]|nr:DUF2254 domain-containing protein [Actinomycetota bacterium]